MTTGTQGMIAFHSISSSHPGTQIVVQGNGLLSSPILKSNQHAIHHRFLNPSPKKSLFNKSTDAGCKLAKSLSLSLSLSLSFWLPNFANPCPSLTDLMRNPLSAMTRYRIHSLSSQNIRLLTNSTKNSKSVCPGPDQTQVDKVFAPIPLIPLIHGCSRSPSIFMYRVSMAFS